MFDIADKNKLIAEIEQEINTAWAPNAHVYVDVNNATLKHTLEELINVHGQTMMRD